VPEFPADESISSHLPLELDKAVNNRVSVAAVREEQCGAMVSFCERNGTPRPEDLFHAFEGEEWIGQVLKEKAHENMVEGVRSERQMKDISLSERDVGDPLLRSTKFCPGQGFPGDINRDKFRAGTVPGKEYGLGAYTARSFEYPASRGIAGVTVEQPG
jgi:hypothetical protein